MEGKNYITVIFLNITQNVRGSVPEKEITFEAWRGFNHDSASKTYQHRLLCPVLSVRTGITKELLSPEANTGLVHIHSTDHHVILAHM